MKTAPREAADADQEEDVWWGGVAPRTLLPGFVVCGVLTGGVLWAAYASGMANPRLAAYLSAGPLWLAQLAAGAYRLTAYNYRLTTKRLFRSRSFFRRGQGVALADVTQVVVARGPLERRLGVGRVCVVHAGDSKPLVFAGVFDPDRVAALVRIQLERCPEQGAK